MMTRLPRLGALCAVLLLLAPSPSVAADVEPTLLRRVAGGFRSLLTPDCAVVLAAGGAASYLSHQSEDPALSARLLDASSVNGGLDVGDLYGHGLTVAGGSALLMTAGTLGHERLGALGRDLLASFAVAAASAWAVKLAVDRPRPLGGPHSFPSGHTAVAFSTLPAIYHHGGRWWGMAATVLATGTGAARMEDQRHYVSDVAFGAALGFASGMAVMGERVPWGPIFERVGFSGRQLRLTFEF